MPAPVPSGASASGAAASLTSALQSLPDTSEPDVNQEHLRTLMDMGFLRERCLEAMQNTGSLDQVIEFYTE